MRVNPARWRINDDMKQKKRGQVFMNSGNPPTLATLIEKVGRLAFSIMNHALPAPIRWR